MARSTKGSKSSWWVTPWTPGSLEDPDAGWIPAGEDSETSWHVSLDHAPIADEAILAPLEAAFGPQVRSRDRVRDLAEVFTHQGEVDAMLDLVPDAFTAIDIKFLEPACGSGNFLVEILRRKLTLVQKETCSTQEQYEHELLRVAASIYGVDISPENIIEARARMAHILLEHFQMDANTVEPTTGFLNAAALILGNNIVLGDTLNNSRDIELCDWQPRPAGCFQRVWSYALVPETDRDLFWMERLQDPKPIHYSELMSPTKAAKKVQEKGRRKP